MSRTIKPLDPLANRCQQRVPVPGMSWRSGSRCKRAAKRDGWCTQHHPDAEKAREKKKKQAFELKRAGWKREAAISGARFEVIEAARAWRNAPSVRLGDALQALAAAVGRLEDLLSGAEPG